MQSELNNQPIIKSELSYRTEMINDPEKIGKIKVDLICYNLYAF